MDLTEAAIIQFSHSLCDRWKERLAAAREARAPFMEIARQCDSFFSKSCGFMWGEEYLQEFLGDGIQAPKFKVTINKAFELVSLFGPYLFWQNPYRHVRAYDQIEFEADIFGDPNDPAVQELYQQALTQQQAELSQNKVRAQLMESWLNYTSREQPGTLAKHAEAAIVEALVKGRGCLWPEHYQFSGSNRNMTGMFFDSVDNLLIDPDCNDPLLQSATWISRRHQTTHAELEDHVGMERGTLRKFASSSSAEKTNAGKRKNYKEPGDMHSYEGRSHDIVEWYKIWSRGGIGDKKLGEDSDHPSIISQTVGDFAYLIVAPNINFALNAPPALIAEASEEELVELFSWPIPCYADSRWPVSLLDFYPLPRSPWPLAPLAPGLGELTALNVLMSALIERGYESRKLVVGYDKSKIADIKKLFDNCTGTVFVPIEKDIEKSIDDILSYIQQPEINNDLIKAIEYVSELFDKRTGLTEFLYASTSTQSRSATDIQAKEEKASIRPDKMSRDVAAWVTEGSDIEKFAAMMFVQGEDARPLVGSVGAMLWDEFVSSVPLEEIFREMRASVEASDMRKPNKNREAENMQLMMQFMLPMLQAYAMATGAETPLNSFIDSLGDAIELDTTEWLLPGPWMPQPDPQAMAMQQFMAEMEMSGKQADSEGKQAAAAAKFADMMAKVQQVQSGQQGDEHMLKMLQSQEAHDQKLEQGQLDMLLKVLESQQNMQVKANEFKFQKGLRESAKKAQSA